MMGSSWRGTGGRQSRAVGIDNYCQKVRRRWGTVREGEDDEQMMGSCGRREADDRETGDWSSWQGAGADDGEQRKGWRRER